MTKIKAIVKQGRSGWLTLVKFEAKGVSDGEAKLLSALDIRDKILRLRYWDGLRWRTAY